MTLEQFTELNKKYRMICEWNDKLTSCIKDSPIMIGDGFRNRVFWQDEEYFNILRFGRDTISEELDKLGIEYISEDCPKEVYFTIKWEYWDKVEPLLKLKKQGTNRVPYVSNKNINSWLRASRFVHERYGEKLDAKVEKQSKENAKKAEKRRKEQEENGN